jgi:hypothetical protein
MRTFAVIWVAFAIALGAAADTNTPVRVRLVDGTELEGVVVEEREQEIVLHQSLAGGTIFKTETLARTNVTAVTPLSEEELAQRAEAAAFEAARRYTLHPTSSYPVDYYAEVIAGVFRPFLEKYPHSTRATEVAGWIGQWQAEQRRVAAGQVRYRGVWLTSAEAGARMEREEGARLMAQARTLAARGRYEQAIATVRLMPGAEAKQFCAVLAPRWVAALESERQSLRTRIEEAEQTVRAAEELRARAFPPPDRSRGLAEGGGTPLGVGPSKEQIAELNKANAAARTAAADAEKDRARLAAVERELARAQAAAREFGGAAATEAKAGGPARGAEHVQDVQSGRVERGETENPELLGQIADFFQQYWMPAAVVVLVGVWFFSRKLSR